MSDSLQRNGLDLELSSPSKLTVGPESHPANLLTVFTETLYPGWTAQHRTMLACNPETGACRIVNFNLDREFRHPMLTMDFMGILSTE